MLRRFIQKPIYCPISIEVRRLSSDILPSSFFMLPLWKFGKGKNAERLKHAQAIQNGSSRYWELGNPKNQYVCIGGMGPVQFDKNYPKVSQLIDFENKEFNKLHVEIQKCPQLLALKILKAFPQFELRKDELRIIKLSYHKYSDQNRGHLDCLIAANHICMKLTEEGDFGFYSGAAIQNANNGILFHNNHFMRTTNTELHAMVKSSDGYLHINNLTENDVGVVYTDCDIDLDGLRKWMEQFD